MADYRNFGNDGNRYQQLYDTTGNLFSSYGNDFNNAGNAVYDYLDQNGMNIVDKMTTPQFDPNMIAQLESPVAKQPAPVEDMRPYGPYFQPNFNQSYQLPDFEQQQQQQVEPSMIENLFAQYSDTFKKDVNKYKRPSTKIARVKELTRPESKAKLQSPQMNYGNLVAGLLNVFDRSHQGKGVRDDSLVYNTLNDYQQRKDEYNKNLFNQQLAQEQNAYDNALYNNKLDQNLFTQQAELNDQAAREAYANKQQELNNIAQMIKAQQAVEDEAFNKEYKKSLMDYRKDSIEVKKMKEENKKKAVNELGKSAVYNNMFSKIYKTLSGENPPRDYLNPKTWRSKGVDDIAQRALEITWENFSKLNGGDIGQTMTSDSNETMVTLPNGNVLYKGIEYQNDL